MAQSMLQLGLCERRGSGVDRAVEAMEKMFLPAYKAESGADFTRVTMMVLDTFEKSSYRTTFPHFHHIFRTSLKIPQA